MANLSISFILALCFISLAVCKVVKVHECVHSKNCHSHDFERVEGADLHENITLSFAVKLKNIDELYRVVDELSDPSSPRFGKHLTFEETNDLVSNLEGQQRIVEHLLKFVKESQILIRSHGGFIQVRTDVKTAERILEGKYLKFKSERSGEEISRTLEFQLPSEVSQWVDYVFPTTQFPATAGKRPLVTMSRKTARGSGILTPTILNSFYNISSNVVTNNLATQSVFSSSSQHFYPKDVRTFQRSFGFRKHPVAAVVGKNQPKICQSDPASCFEASLDVQYIMSVAQMAPTTFWSTGFSFSGWMEEVASSPNPPLVHSISYGTYEEHTTEEEQQRFAQEVAKLGARGVTVVVASGDDGASLYGARNNPSYCGFHAAYPANVPYVLSVGATMGPESSGSEKPCSSDQGSAITTGGGFSKIFPRPQYQDDLVQQYFTSAYNNPSASLMNQAPQAMINTMGRGFPDVAIAGNNYQVIINGKAYIASGTSASAPVFAGIITLANNARLNLGKSSLGFVNPALYRLFRSNPSIFNDIQSGDNRCTASSVCCQYGFNSIRGWDPVSGLGSVNAGRLIEALVNL